MSFSPSPLESGSAFRELDTQLRQLLQDLINDTAFFAFPFEDMDHHFLPITCHVDHRTTPAITTDASLDAAVSTVGGMLQEPRHVKLTEYGPPGWASFFNFVTGRVLKAADLSSRPGYVKLSLHESSQQIVIILSASPVLRGIPMTRFSPLVVWHIAIWVP